MTKPSSPVNITRIIHITELSNPRAFASLATQMSNATFRIISARKKRIITNGAAVHPAQPPVPQAAAQGSSWPPRF
jgi:hypothetical protein